MKNFTKIFIKRPVLSSVVSLLILILGVSSIFKLPLRQYPKINSTTIVISTLYPGANAQIVQGFVTIPLERSIASSDGIDYIESSSILGLSNITVHIKVNYNIENVLNDISGKINIILSQLPKSSSKPSIIKSNMNIMPNIILSFNNKNMSPEEITTYLNNFIIPDIYSVGGVSQASIFGEKKYSMRIWLDANKMQQLGVTPIEVYNSLLKNNISTTAGQLKSKYMYIDINIDTYIKSVKDFNNMIIKDYHGHLVRMKDIGKAVLGPQSYRTKVFYSGKESIFIGISSASNSNPISVIKKIKYKISFWKSHFPPGMQVNIVYDGTKYIHTSIYDVIYTIIESSIIVAIVIFLFLGSFQSVFIPMITVPLSLIGVCSFIFFMGFSINLLTLLAMVLAIGLVVDDSIVVLENAHRHIKKSNLSPINATIKASREITNPIIIMTTTLIAVFAPIGFISDITGSLFREFAFTLAGAVLISGILSLVLSPMMCSKIISKKTFQNKLVQFIENILSKIRNFYEKMLNLVLNYRFTTAIMGCVIFISCYFLFIGTTKEFVPIEDQGYIGIIGIGPSWANLNYLTKYNSQIEKIFHTFPEVKDTFSIDGIIPDSHSIFSAMILKSWNKREKSQMIIASHVNQELQKITGLQAVAIQFPSLPGIPYGPGVQIVLKTASDYKKLYMLSENFIKHIMKNDMFIYANNSLKFDKPLLNIHIFRDKTNMLGISMQDIALAMSVMIGNNAYNYFNIQGNTFEVIPQVFPDFRKNPNALKNIYISTQFGKLIPIYDLVSMKYTSQPSSLTHFNLLNSTTIQLAMNYGIKIEDAVKYIKKEAKKILPSDITYNFIGSARKYLHEGNTLLYTFIFSMIIIYLLLSAQFESFRDPFIILVSVPMSICGALMPLYLGFATINIYTEIGLITLIGLISKHGILMIDFANTLQKKGGYSIYKSIKTAAKIRFRPIFMTTLAMIFGVIPLIHSSGAGSISRYNIGLVIFFGISVGTFFTLFIVPVTYTFLAKKHNKEI